MPKNVSEIQLTTKTIDMKRLLFIILFAMLAIRSQAQFVSSFSSSYVNEKKNWKKQVYGLTEGMKP